MTNTGMQKQAEHMQGKSYRSKNCCPPPFLAVPGCLSLEYLLKLQTQSLWGEEVWMGEGKGGHNPPPLTPLCCWMPLHGCTAFQTLRLRLYLPWIL